MVTGDWLYLGSCSGSYYAFDRITGDVRWSFDAGQDGRPALYHGNAVLTDELVITPTDGSPRGFVYALERANGAVRWKRALGGISTDLLLLDGLVVALADDGALVALRAADGSEAWRVAVGEEGASHAVRRLSPASDGTLVYFARPGGHIAAVEAASGEQKWQVELGSRISTALLASGGALYVGSSDGHLHRLAADDGQVLARLDLGAAPAWAPLLLADRVIVLLGHRAAHDVVGLDRELSRVVWRYRSAEPLSTPGAYAWRELALVGDDEGTLTALDPAGGEPAWSIELDGALRGVGSAGETLYVGTVDGRIFAYRTGDPGR